MLDVSLKSRTIAALTDSVKNIAQKAVLLIYIESAIFQ